MVTKLLVMSFSNQHLSSDCKVISSDEGLSAGQIIRVDLTVNADFGEMPESELVEKTVIVDRLQPFEMIGVGVRICEGG